MTSDTQPADMATPTMAELHAKLEIINNAAWRHADNSDNVELGQSIEQGYQDIAAALDELAADREWIVALEARAAQMEAIIQDTAKIGTYFHWKNRNYACPGCNGSVEWGDKTPLEHDEDCPINAARALLAEGESK